MSISEHKPMPEPVRRMEVFTGAGRRRSWSAAEKAAIVAESYGAGETVCGAAGRDGAPGAPRCGAARLRTVTDCHLLLSPKPFARISNGERVRTERLRRRAIDHKTYIDA